MGIDLTIGLDDEAGGEFVRIDDVDEVVVHNGGVVHRGNRLLQSLVNVNSFLHAPVGFALTPEIIPSLVVLLDFVDGNTLESSLATVNVAQVDRILEHGTNLTPTILVTNNRTLLDVIHCGNSVSEF